MRKFVPLCLVLAMFLSPVLSWAGGVTPLEQSIVPGSITFVGDVYHHPAAVQLLKSLIAKPIKSQQCITVAIELDENQQTNIDKVLKGKAKPAVIKLPSRIDHLAFRRLMKNLKQLSATSKCLRVVAIDADIDKEFQSDEWMARKISELPNDGAIVVLSGNLHTLKKVEWTAETGESSSAEILSRKSYTVKSFPQIWMVDKCSGKKTNRFVNADNPEALKMLNDNLIPMLNARPYKSVENVIDGVVVWECQNKQKVG